LAVIVFVGFSHTILPHVFVVYVALGLNIADSESNLIVEFQTATALFNVVRCISGKHIFTVAAWYVLMFVVHQQNDARLVIEEKSYNCAPDQQYIAVPQVENVLFPNVAIVPCIMFTAILQPMKKQLFRFDFPQFVN